MSRKIIRILNGMVSIASNDGTFFNIPISELNFEPKIGDEVQCFKNGEKIIVFKKSSSDQSASLPPLRNNQNVPEQNNFDDKPKKKKSNTFFVLLTVVVLLVAGGVGAYLYFDFGRTGTMIDPRDGKKYKTVRIGSQIWMAENLNYAGKNSFCYDNDPKNCAEYGRLYTWYVAMKACPTGWHLPSSNEWITLERFVAKSRFGGNTDSVGYALKSTKGWFGFGNGSDAVKFGALPAGYRYNGRRYSDVLKETYFWSSTESFFEFIPDIDIGKTNAETRYLKAIGTGLYSLGAFKSSANSVRCVKDD